MSQTAKNDAQTDASVKAASHKLLASLKTMLDAYWGEGDGMTPPKFITDAQEAVQQAEGRA